MNLMTNWFFSFLLNRYFDHRFIYNNILLFCIFWGMASWIWIWIQICHILCLDSKFWLWVYWFRDWGRSLIGVRWDRLWWVAYRIFGSLSISGGFLALVYTPWHDDKSVKEGGKSFLVSFLNLLHNVIYLRIYFSQLCETMDKLVCSKKMGILLKLKNFQDFINGDLWFGFRIMWIYGPDSTDTGWFLSTVWWSSETWLRIFYYWFVGFFPFGLLPFLHCRFFNFIILFSFILSAKRHLRHY